LKLFNFFEKIVVVVHDITPSISKGLFAWQFLKRNQKKKKMAPLENFRTNSSSIFNFNNIKYTLNQ